MTGRGQDQGHGRPLLAEPVWPGAPAAPSGTVGPVELHIIPPGLLDDLYGPDLVIDPGYIGPDRRRTPRERHETSPTHDRSSGIVRTLLIVLVTAVAAVLLTLMAIHPAPSATAATPLASGVAARSQAPGTNGLRTAAPTRPVAPTGRAAAGATRARGTAPASARIACVPAGASTGASCVRRREAAHRRALAHLRALRRALRSERAARRDALRRPSAPAR